MSSTEFDDESEAKRPTVQVGDPFAEKLLIEFKQCLIDFKNIIIAVLDEIFDYHIKFIAARKCKARFH